MSDGEFKNDLMRRNKQRALSKCLLVWSVVFLLGSTAAIAYCASGWYPWAIRGNFGVGLVCGALVINWSIYTAGPPRWDFFHQPVTQLKWLWIPELTSRLLVLPLWLIAVGSIAGLVCSLATLRRLARRPLAGYCIRCGYCMKGNMTGRCPECGRAVTVDKEES